MKTLFLITTIAFIFCGSIAAAKLSINDIDFYDKDKLNAIEKRYSISANATFFSDQQASNIEAKQLIPTIRALILHNTIILKEPQDLLDFAENIFQSGNSFWQLESRIMKYMEDGDLVFTALTKAINRENIHKWKQEKIKEVIKNKGPYIQQVKAWNLSYNDENRIIRVYAVCIAPYSNPSDRKDFLQPHICDPHPEFKKPQHLISPVNVRELKDHHITSQVLAYRHLVSHATEVADKYKLDTFEKIKMSKCIAEQSLKFFTPSHHPIKAFKKDRQIKTKSPEKSFFMHKGVCSNFSSIAYNVANELGLRNQVKLARNGVHVYLEFEQDGNWFHSHPFNNHTHCDIVRY